MGEIIGAIIGMALVGSGLAWCIRRVFRSTDYKTSLGIAMLVVAFASGFTNTQGGRPYWLTVTIYLVAGIPGYFLVLWLSNRNAAPALSKRAEPRMAGAVGQDTYIDEEPEADYAAEAPRFQTNRSTRPATGLGSVAWGRGFFRLWAVVALLWVIILGLAMSNTVTSPYVPTKALATPTGGTTPDIFDTYGSPYNELSTAVNEGKLSQIDVRPGYTMFYPLTLDDVTRAVRVAQAQGVVDNYIATETVSRRNSAIGLLLAVLLIPPVVVFILGWLLGWAISGFRRTA